jgi:hypothetical protein
MEREGEEEGEGERYGAFKVLPCSLTFNGSVTLEQPGVWAEALTAFGRQFQVLFHFYF